MNLNYFVKCLETNANQFFYSFITMYLFIPRSAEKADL